jgi:hypothetical protein
MQAKFMKLLNNPEATNIKVSSYSIGQTPQQQSPQLSHVIKLKKKGNVKFIAMEYFYQAISSLHPFLGKP